MTSNPRPRFEVSGSLLYLQPGAGNLEYGTLVTPLPLVTPNWSNQSLKPDFSPAFRFGARYMPTAANDVELNWTYLNTIANGSVFGRADANGRAAFLIGPESALYKIGHGAVKSDYDSVNLDGGHTFCAECPFQLRVFGGVEVARIGQNLSGLFQSPDGTASNGYTTNSLFTGAGPRLGLKGQYDIGNFQFIGEVAGAGLIGTSQSRINFSTNSPAAGLNNQCLTSPNATQVIPSIDARLATAYTFPLTSYGLFKIELGYQAAVYFNAVSQYSLTNVPTMLTLPPVGIYPGNRAASAKQFHGPGPVSDRELGVLEHDPEKWKPVFGKDHAPLTNLEAAATALSRSSAASAAAGKLPNLSHAPHMTSGSAPLNVRVLALGSSAGKRGWSACRAAKRAPFVAPCHRPACWARRTAIPFVPALPPGNAAAVPLR